MQISVHRQCQMRQYGQAFPVQVSPCIGVVPHIASWQACLRLSVPVSVSLRFVRQRSQDPLSEVRSRLFPCLGQGRYFRQHELYCHHRSIAVHAGWHQSHGY